MPPEMSSGRQRSDPNGGAKGTNSAPSSGPSLPTGIDSPIALANVSAPSALDLTGNQGHAVLVRKILNGIFAEEPTLLSIDSFYTPPGGDARRTTKSTLIMSLVFSAAPAYFISMAVSSSPYGGPVAYALLTLSMMWILPKLDSSRLRELPSERANFRCQCLLPENREEGTVKFQEARRTVDSIIDVIAQQLAEKKSWSLVAGGLPKYGENLSPVDVKAVLFEERFLAKKRELRADAARLLKDQFGL